MKPKPLSAILCLTALLALCPTAPRASADAPPKGAGPTLPFPDVEGWTHTPPRPLDTESGGYSLAYEAAASPIVVTFYAYNRGLPKVEDNLTSAPIRREFDGAKNGIAQAVQQGYYKDAKEQESGESTLGRLKSAPKCLYARYAITMKDRATTSEIYVLPYRNHFIKIRVSRLAAEDATTAPALDRLHTALSKMLTTPD